MSAISLTKNIIYQIKKIIFLCQVIYNGNTNFGERRGKTTGPTQGRPKAIKPINKITTYEYSEHLEIKIDILKLLAEADV